MIERNLKIFHMKNFTIIALLAIAGLLLISTPVFAHGENENGVHCGQLRLNTDQLSKEQAEKIDQIQDRNKDNSAHKSHH